MCLPSNALRRAVARQSQCADYERNPFFEKTSIRSRAFTKVARTVPLGEAPVQQNARKPTRTYGPSSPQQEMERVMNEWLKPQIQESEAGMEVTSYLPAELDRA